jgi:Hemerythrin HHE cation binding domain
MTAERVDEPGAVDFTMMYAAHDAFGRHLDRLVEAAAGDAAWSAATATRWTDFSGQLHNHHRAEDDALWPPLRRAVSAPEEVAVLDAMEAEHAGLDPALAAVQRAIAAHDRDELFTGLNRLRTGLTAHMRHEESVALPLVERHLGPAGWAAFGTHIRRTQGVSGAAAYLPWLLDDAPDELRAQVLALLPAPVRTLNKLIWEPRYRRGR